jgi:hypothetical protein
MAFRFESTSGSKAPPAPAATVHRRATPTPGPLWSQLARRVGGSDHDSSDDRHRYFHGAGESVRRAVASTGRPLDGDLRSEFERRFGHDFRDVRVHADAPAAASAHLLRASAYTVGNDLVFASGSYSPDSAEGKRLIAHELAHVAQQEESAPAGGLTVSEPGDASEVEADRAAERVVRGERVTVGSGGGGGGAAIARQPLPGETGEPTADHFVNPLGAAVASKVAKLVGQVDHNIAGDTEEVTHKRLRRDADQLGEFYSVALGSVDKNLAAAIRYHGYSIPDWCGIYALWAMKLVGMGVGNWKIGSGISSVEGMKQRRPDEAIELGDVAAKTENGHMATVVSVQGNDVTTIDGNSGKVGGEITGPNGPKPRSAWDQGFYYSKK